MTNTKINVVPTSYQEVVAVLKSETLRAVEDEIASQTQVKVIHDYSTASTTHVQAEMSVSGMSPSRIESFLLTHRDTIIAFGIRLLKDEQATRDDEEYPEGEEQDASSDESMDLGLATGFGIKYAIYCNFLENRSSGEFHAFLKNRRVPRHTEFARELKRLFGEANSRQIE